MKMENFQKKTLRVFENVMKYCQGKGENDKNDSSNFSFQKQLSQKETQIINHFPNYFITFIIWKAK